jgi:hypothetical protein
MSCGRKIIGAETAKVDFGRKIFALLLALVIRFFYSHYKLRIVCLSCENDI